MNWGDFRVPLVRLALRAALLPVLLAGPVVALQPSKKLSQYNMTRYSTEQGMPHSNVESTVQTRDGYIWVATDEGLARFDGLRFRVFNKRNTAGFLNDSVNQLVEDREGGLWVGTSGGLFRFSEGRVRQGTKRDPVLEQRILALVLGAEGCVYAGTTNGLLRVCGEQVERVAGLPETPVQSLAAGLQGEIWIGTRDAGLWRYASGEVQRVAGRAGALPSRPISLFVDSAGRLWVGLREGGVWRGKIPDLGDIAPVPSAGPRTYAAFAEAPAGYVWGACQDGHLTRMSAESSEDYLVPLPGKSPAVQSLMFDREGNLWLGTWNDGLLRVRDGFIKAYSSEEGLGGDEFWTVLEDRKGGVWAGAMGGGVSLLTGGRTEVFTKANGLPSDNVRSLAEALDGSIWVAFFDAPLARLKDGKASVYKTADGRTIGPAWSLMSGRNGALLFGSRDCGVCRLDGGVLVNLQDQPGFPRIPASAILEDDSGTLWIGTNGEGLVRLGDGQVKVFRREDGLASGNIMAMHQDSAGKLWLATEGEGLIRFDGKSFKSVGLKEGLSEDSLASILEDDDGFFWFSTNHGLVRVSKKDAEDVMDGKKETVASLTFDTLDGMKSAEATGSTLPNAWKGKDGTLWFTTVKGIVAVDPVSVKRPAIEPEVIVETVEHSNVPLKRVGKGYSVGAGTNAVEFRYTAFLFREAENLEFRYRLDGLDSEWTEAGNRRTAFFTHLPPGEYGFRVSARRKQGTWQECRTPVLLSVEPRFFETTLFKLFVLMLIASVAAAGIKLRFRGLEKRRIELEERVLERTREVEAALRKEAEARAEADGERRRAEDASRAKSAFVASMSHELRTPLNAILGFVQVMVRAKGRTPEDRRYLDIISNSGEHLLALINDILSIAKIEAGQVEIRRKPFPLQALLVSAVDMVRPRAEGKGLDLELVAPGPFPLFVVGDERRIRQVLLNLLSNAVKFTARGSVTLRAEWKDGTARIEVEDTGGGISPDEQVKLFQAFVQAEAGWRSGEGTGLGLSISRNLIRLMGGELEVESQQGKGTKFFFLLEMPQGKSLISRATARRVVGLAPGQTSRKILVADDTEENRLLLAEMLRTTGLEVLEAADGLVALELWRNENPDLVFLDQRMPGMPGSQVLLEIRRLESELPARARTPVIALTTSVFEENLRSLMADGFDDVVAKPIQHGDVFDRLSRFLGLAFVFEEISGDYQSRSRVKSGEIHGNVVTIPKELRDRLRQASVESDLAAALEVVAEIGKTEPAIAKTLRELAEGFRFDEIEGVLGGHSR